MLLKSNLLHQAADLFHPDALIIRFDVDDRAARRRVHARGVAAAQAIGAEDYFRPALGALGNGQADATSGGGNAGSDYPLLGGLVERGAVSDIVPLRRPRDKGARAALSNVPSGLRGLELAAAMSVAEPSPRPSDRPLAGAVLVRFAEGEDGRQGLKHLEAAQEVRASRVPARYMQARSRTGMSVAALPPIGDAWRLQRIRLREARRLKTFVEPVAIKVAVLDTGIDEAHPLLGGQISSYTYDYPGLNVPSGPKDIVGHGTHVAGVIMAARDKRSGVQGLCRCRLLVWKVFPDRTTFVPSLGYFTYLVDPAMYLAALADCLDEDVDVVNLSLGGPAPPSPEEQNLYDALMRNGSVIVAAMGNHRQSGSPVTYPAGHPGVIAVGATDRVDRVARFSNRGSHISLCAPGYGVWSTMPTQDGRVGFEVAVGPDNKRTEGKPIVRERDFDELDGTSMAAPHVSAAVAMFRATKGVRDTHDTLAALRSSADRTPEMGAQAFHPDYGCGRLNLETLLSQPPQA